MRAELTIATIEKDLLGILKLQATNLKTEVTNQKSGYVTATHDLNLLTRMNSPFPHSILKISGEVVGYALVMLPAMKNEIDILIPMFDLIDSCTYDGKPINQEKYFVMGQICIAVAHRRKGYFSNLYSHLIERLRNTFDYIITEVDSNNQRSMGAHLHYGFEVLQEYESAGINWTLLVKKMI